MSPWIDRDKMRKGIDEEVAGVRTPDDPDLRYVVPDQPVPTPSGSCATDLCGGRATYQAAIYDGVSDTPIWAPYCDNCAGILQRGGDDVRPLPHTAADDLNEAIDTLGGRLRAVERERDRYRKALEEILATANRSPTEDLLSAGDVAEEALNDE